MATSASAMLLLAIAFISVANFCTCFPRALLSHDHQPLNSVLSTPSFTSEINFCSLDNRACSSEMTGFNPFAAVYEVYQGIDNNSPVNLNVDYYTFFRQSILKPGNKIHLSNSQNQFPERARLPVEAIEAGYEVNKVQTLIYQFVTPATRETIRSSLCNSPAMGSEFKSCLKSVEEMVEFSKTVLGGNLVALTTKSTKVSGAGNKELLIGDVKKMNVDKMVSCHGLLLDTATYFCHSMSATQVYVVDVINPETNAPVNTVLAACHMDTSTWTKEHVAFKILNSSPGKIEVCHWNTDLDLVWVANNN